MIGRWLGLLGATAVIGAMTMGCGLSQRTAVQGTTKSVGTDAVIEIVHLEEDVNMVKVELINLPPPERHKEGLKHFVVWIKPLTQGAVAIKAGRLAYDAEARTGVLEATTPNHELYVQVTAEETSKVTKPGSFLVLDGHVVLKGHPEALRGDGS